MFKKTAWSFVLLLGLAMPVIPAAYSAISPESVSAAEPGMEDIFQLFKNFKESYNNIHDYSAKLHKEELSESGKWTKEELDFRFKKPFAVKIKWVKGPRKEREVVFIEGANNNKLKVKLGGLIGIIIPSVDVDPNSDMAKDEAGHTIRQAGLGYLMEEIAKVTSDAYDKNELSLKVLEKKNDILKIERILPAGKGYKTERLVIYVNHKLGIPIGIERYTAKGKMFGKYIYDDLKTNQGLKDSEFKL
ncbi:MAG: DUF1571 domain-containing protein [Candidatus Omnitrophica bacterium]|nr:DUF1571 domain-containing protein [Candidatus Omnitrophota bacterium]